MLPTPTPDRHARPWPRRPQGRPCVRAPGPVARVYTWDRVPADGVGHVCPQQGPPECPGSREAQGWAPWVARFWGGILVSPSLPPDTGGLLCSRDSCPPLCLVTRSVRRWHLALLQDLRGQDGVSHLCPFPGPPVPSWHLAQNLSKDTGTVIAYSKLGCKKTGPASVSSVPGAGVDCWASVSSSLKRESSLGVQSVLVSWPCLSFPCS